MAISEILAALADDTRRNILNKLKERTISSGDLAIYLGISPQALSYHLAKLKKADLIYETRRKNFIYYELNLTVLDEAILWITRLRDPDALPEEQHPLKAQENTADSAKNPRVSPGIG